jgi:hypothetical protein
MNQLSNIQNRIKNSLTIVKTFENWNFEKIFLKIHSLKKEIGNWSFKKMSDGVSV